MKVHLYRQGSRMNMCGIPGTASDTHDPRKVTCKTCWRRFIQNVAWVQRLMMRYRLEDPIGNKCWGTWADIRSWVHPKCTEPVPHAPHEVPTEEGELLGHESDDDPGDPMISDNSELETTW